MIKEICHRSVKSHQQSHNNLSLSLATGPALGKTGGTGKLLHAANARNLLSRLNNNQTPTRIPWTTTF
jgi:hypothetical protein